MESDAQDRLAEAQAALIQDRQTFERQVNAVYERLTEERLQLGEEHRRLLAGRSHLVLIGKRLRRRWHGQKKTAERESREREKLLLAWTRQLEIESAKNQKEQAALHTLRDQLAARAQQAAEERRRLEAEQSALTKQRTALVDFRIAVEADCRHAQERRSLLQGEVRELEGQVQALRGLHVELEALPRRPYTSPHVSEAPAQKVA